MKEIILIGYSGHGFVACSVLQSAGYQVTGYCDNEQKGLNPYSLQYVGSEKDEKNLSVLQQHNFFISIGNNLIRRTVADQLADKNLFSINAIHTSSIIDNSVVVNKSGVMIGALVCINPLSIIERGAICNTGCIIEHECIIGDFAHIAPGAVLCGNVRVGENSFVGAKSVIRENITIGKNVIIGAGSVVVKDIPDNAKVIGNPARII